MAICAYCNRETGTALNYHPDCKERARLAKRDLGRVPVHTVDRPSVAAMLRGWLAGASRGLATLAWAPADLPLFERRLLRSDRELFAVCAVVLPPGAWGTWWFAELIRHGDRGGDTIFLVLCSGMASALAAWYLAAAVRWSANPARHPSMRALAVHGAPREMAAELSHEMRPGSGTRMIGATLFTANWLIQAATLRITAIPFRDLVWIYETTGLRMIHFIPIGETHNVVVHGASGARISIGGGSDLGEGGSANAQRELLSRAPWALRGRSLSTILSMKWRNRAGTVATVLAKREQMLKGEGRAR